MAAMSKRKLLISENDDKPVGFKVVMNVFVLRSQDIQLLEKIVDSKSFYIAGVYDNGFLVSFSTYSEFTLAILMLEDRKIFFQSFRPEKMLRLRDQSSSCTEWQKWCTVAEDPDGFELKFIDTFIGHGVFCKKKIEKGQFLLEYKGSLIKKQDEEEFEDESFIYFFKDKIYSCIDARYSNGLGRMVNDEIFRKANAKMKLMTLDGIPHLCLFSVRDIEFGEELRYDYGVPSKNLHWRKKLLQPFIRILLLIIKLKEKPVLYPGPPSEPVGPVHITAVTEDTATFDWALPIDNGGSPVTGCRIMLSKNDSDWSEVSTVGKFDKEYTAKNLEVGQTYIFRIIGLNKIGESKPLDSEPLTIKKQADKPSAPEGPLEITNVTLDSAWLSWKPPKGDGGSPLTKYIIEFSDNGRVNWSKAGEVKPEVTNFTVGKLLLNNEYVFRVSAVNAEGHSFPLTSDKTAKPTKKLSAPSPPQYVKVTKVVKNSVNLEWSAPVSYDGSKIRRYQIWKRIEMTNDWVTVTSVESYKTSYTISDLDFDVTFIFGVTAEDDVGVSERCDTESGVKIEKPKDVPSAPVSPLEISDVHKTKAKLSWQPSEKDGGSPITEYVIYKREGWKSTFSEAGKVKPNVTTFELTDLKEGEDYFVQVKAVNDVGQSKPLEADAFFKAKSPYSVPDMPMGPIKFSHILETGVTLEWSPRNDGGTPIIGYRLELTIDTKVWTEVTLTDDQTTKTEVKDLATGQTYRFRVSAINKIGQSKPLESGEVTLTKPTGPPGPPSHPLIGKVLSNDSIELSWQSPEDDGGSPITAYLVEKRDTQHTLWTRVDTTDKTTLKLTVQNFNEGNELFFRVFATNKHGQSEALEMSKPILTKCPVDKPSPPVGPVKFSKLTENSVDLAWKPSKSDGGTPITCYAIEISESRHTMWGKAGTVDAKTTKFTAKKLVVNNEYVFRIKAINTEGESEPLNGDESVIPKKKFELPGAPNNLNITDIGETEINIEWHPPTKDGGSRIKKYHIFIKSKATDGNWVEVDTVDAFKVNYTIPKMDAKDRYYIGVSAENDVGQGNMAETDKTYSPKQPINKPSPPVGPVKFSKLTENSVNLAWKPSKSDGGTPTTCYAIEISESRHMMWGKAGTVDAKTTKFTAKKLVVNNEYVFRIKAINTKGESEPLNGDESVIPKKKFELPGAPNNLNITDIGETEINIEWHPPTKDGGSRIKKYHIFIKSKATDDNWVEVDTVDAFKVNYTIPKMDAKDRYYIGVSAENDVGQGNMAETDKTYSPKQPISYRCNDCSETFEKVIQLQIHRQRKHFGFSTENCSSEQETDSSEAQDESSDQCFDSEYTDEEDPSYIPEETDETDSEIEDQAECEITNTDLIQIQNNSNNNETDSEIEDQSNYEISNTTDINSNEDVTQSAISKIGDAQSNDISKGYDDGEYISDSYLSDEYDFIQPIIDRISKNIPVSVQESTITSSYNKERQGSSKDPSYEQKKKKNKKTAISLQSASNKEGTRVWDKIHFCLFCGISSTNITKHVLKKHKEESQVQEILMHQKKSKARKLLIKKLNNAGDYKHNMEVLKCGSGTLVTWTRNINDSKADEFLPCPDCLAFFIKRNLWRHVKTCPFRNGKAHGRRITSESSLMMPTTPSVSTGLQLVLSNMSADEVTIAVRNDPLIIQFGERLYQKHGHKQHLFNFISQKMREVARFLITFQHADETVKCLSDVVCKPEMFMEAARITKVLCKYCPETNTFGIPSLALKIGQSLKKCAVIKSTEAASTGKTDIAASCQHFRSLCKDEWADLISSSALRTLNDAKMNKGQCLPLTEDIKKLQVYLKEQTVELTKKIEDKIVKSVWDKLNLITLVTLVLFNRKRGGEVERIHLDTYVHRNSKNVDLKEIEESLSPLENVLCRTFARVEIVGKRGRTVPILFTPRMQKTLDFLIKYRKDAGVHKDNPYLFPRSSFDSLFPIRSSDGLRTVAIDCGAVKPELLTSTRLRKHIATVSQILNLEKNELETMANFMGHDINIHRAFYRLPQKTLEVAKIGKLLMAFDKGVIAKFSGKTLDEIDVECEISDGEEEMSDEELPENDNRADGGLEGQQGIQELPENENRADGGLEGQQGIQGSKSNHKQNGRKRWSDSEQRAVLRHLENFILARRLPGKSDVEKCLKAEPVLKGRTWRNVRDFCRNRYISLERKCSKK